MKTDKERKINFILEVGDEVLTKDDKGKDLEVKKDGFSGAHIPMSKKHIGKKAFVILSDKIDYSLERKEENSNSSE